MPHSIDFQERVTAGGVTTTYTRTKTAGSRVAISEEIADGATNVLVAFTLDVSQCKFFLIQSDVAMTVKTNNSGTPADTIVLVAGEPYVWALGMIPAFELGTDVTALYVTNASGEDGTLTVEALTDPTV